MMKNEMTLMKYKSVLVYTGYAENGVEKVKTFSATSLLDATMLVEECQLDRMLEDDNGLDEDWYNEFFGNGRVVNGVGFVESGEENVTLVLGEFNEWFDKVDSFDTWSDELYAKWNEFLGVGTANFSVS